MKTQSLFFFALLFANGSFACSCLPQEGDDDQALADAVQQATVVVLATVKKVDTEFADDEQMAMDTTHFSTVKIWKGQPGKTFATRMHTAGNLCGLKFTQAKTYLLYLSGPGQDGFYSTNNCSRTAEQAQAGEDIKRLDSSPSK